MAHEQFLARLLAYLRRASTTNHPYVELGDNEVLGSTYAAMMHSIAAHLEAVDGHQDVSICFVAGILEGLGESVPHDHPTMSQATPAPAPQAAPATDVQPQGEVLPQADQEAIVAAFRKGLDALPTYGEEAPKERYYLAEGTDPEHDFRPVSLVVDRISGMAYPFGTPKNADAGLAAIKKDAKLVDVLYGNEAAHYGHSVQS
ncbi:hypothetical protein SEA_VROOMVROOM_62 [Arthrobacter phage VroomVroom]|uniref:Uncharacterized protein n=1 Tax=Arthrobacter phage VroomVroom TaxID=3049371 RepID=A0AA49FAE7_9CAUD|nr:hypothetical protein SEA_VROOMVROOM_62 [Arthrobacter phage VroomVroom]